MNFNPEEIHEMLARGAFEGVFDRLRKIDGDPTEKAHAAAGMALLFLTLGDVSQAKKESESSVTQSLKSQNREATAAAYLAMTRCLLATGEMEKVRVAYRRASEAARQSGPEWIFQASLIVGAEIALHAGNGQDVLETVNANSSTPLWSVPSSLLRARAHVSTNRLDLAHEEISKAIKLAQSAELNDYLWRAYALAGEIEEARGRHDEAKGAREEARHIFERIAAPLSPQLQRHYLAVAHRMLPLEPSAGTVAEIQHLADAIHTINEQMDIMRALENALDAFLRLSGAERGIIVVHEQGQVQWQASRDTKHQTLDADALELSQTLLQRALAGEDVVILNTTDDPAIRAIGSVRLLGIVSVACLPLRTRGRIVGAVYVDCRARPLALSEGRIGLLRAVAGHIALAIDNARLYSRSIHDVATELHNHTYFETRLGEELSRSERKGRSITVLVLDLDNFKTINDTYGHAVGTALLREFAKFLADTVRGQDIVSYRGEDCLLARYGGDEFELLLSETDAKQAEQLCTRLIKTLSEKTFTVNKTPITLSATIGTATYPQDGTTPEALFLRADEALCAAKQQGKGQALSWSQTQKAAPKPTDLEVGSLTFTREGREAIAVLEAILDKADDPESMIREALEHIVQMTGAGRGFILLFNERGEPVLHAAHKVSEDDLTADRIPVSFGIVEHVRRHMRTTVISNTLEDRQFSGRQSVQGLGAQSVLSVPIVNEGRACGVIYLDAEARQKQFSRHDLSLCTTFAHRAGKYFTAAEKYWEQNQRLRVLESRIKHLAPSHLFGTMVGKSKSMRDVFTLLERAATVPYPVLITGETGTGKELAAREIHGRSPRQSQTFVPVNCAAVPENLLESELFGHVKGSFTGATHDEKGVFEIADEGTLFLDEIENMPEAMQKKLLRVLEEQAVRPVGSRSFIKVDVRIVSATNIDLRDLVRKRFFREDLYHRLNVISLHLRPLRERVEDIPVLIRHLTEKLKRELSREHLEVPEEVVRLFTAYSWPGNVREMENELRRLAVICGESIQAELVSSHIRAVVAPTEASSLVDENVERVERDLIAKAIEEADGNISRAAETLRMNRITLTRRIKKYGLERRS